MNLVWGFCGIILYFQTDQLKMKVPHWDNMNIQLFNMAGPVKMIKEKNYILKKFFKIIVSGNWYNWDILQ